MKKSKILYISVMINIVFIVVSLYYVCKAGYLRKSVDVIRGGYSYIDDNPQYNAYMTIFDLSKRKSAKIVFAGDSITAKGRFEEFFNEKDIVNRGIGSDTAEGLYHRIHQITDLNPDKVFIMIGINDISTNADLEQSVMFVADSCEMIRKNNSDAEIYIMSVLPTTNTEWTAQIEDLNSRYYFMCEREGYIFVDLYSRFLIDDRVNDKLLYDGVHLNGAGYKLWIDMVQEYID